MKTIALVVCVPQDAKSARFIKVITAGIKVALMLVSAKNVKVNVSEAEYDSNSDTVDTAINVTWE